MSEETTSLYERVGGADALGPLMDDFYRRVLADPELSPFFENTSMDKLRKMQREFFSAALDGPVTYTGRPLNEAHAGLGIRRRHFRAFLAHLLETLEALGLSDREVRDVIERISTYQDEILGSVSEAG